MRTLWNHDAEVATFVGWLIEKETGCNPGFTDCVAVGVISSTGQMLGGVVFTEYREACGSIVAAHASIKRNWLTKRLLTEILSYPFVQLGVTRLQAVTPRHATSPRRFLDKFGFRCEGIARSAFGPGKDAAIYSLLAREWARSRFNLNGQVVTQTAAAA